MNQEPSLNDRIKAFNDNLKAAGIYEERDPWTLPNLYEGSILDIPVTPEAMQRIEAMKQMIAEMKREKLAEETAFHVEVVIPAQSPSPGATAVT